jgi:hypothetical protein
VAGLALLVLVVGLVAAVAGRAERGRSFKVAMEFLGKDLQAEMQIYLRLTVTVAVVGLAALAVQLPEVLLVTAALEYLIALLDRLSFMVEAEAVVLLQLLLVREALAAEEMAEREVLRDHQVQQTLAVAEAELDGMTLIRVVVADLVKA